VLLDVEERCTTAPLNAVEPDAAPGREPSLGELFHEFVAESGSADANNERIVAYFGTLLAATENREPFAVPEFDGGFKVEQSA
jgi:hypothetical protein